MQAEEGEEEGGEEGGAALFKKTTFIKKARFIKKTRTIKKSIAIVYKTKTHSDQECDDAKSQDEHGTQEADNHQGNGVQKYRQSFAGLTDFCRDEVREARASSSGFPAAIIRSVRFSLRDRDRIQ